MNRYRYSGNQKPDRKPFSGCERCGRVWKEDFKCCDGPAQSAAVAGQLPARGSFKTTASHQEILDNARQEMLEAAAEDYPDDHRFDEWEP